MNQPQSPTSRLASACGILLAILSGGMVGIMLTLAAIVLIWRY